MRTDSSKWSYAGSDGTTRDESNAQKTIAYEAGNTNQGASYFITPEGQKITLTWTADENGFVATGDHCPLRHRSRLRSPPCCPLFPNWSKSPTTPPPTPNPPTLKLSTHLHIANM